MKTNARFVIDNSKPRRKGVCPQCGTRKTFSRFIDTRGEIRLPEYVGICDRRNKCGYCFTPQQYLRLTPASMWSRDPSKAHLRRPRLHPEPPVAPTFVDAEKARPTLAGIEGSSLFRFLASRLGTAEARRAMTVYGVGTLPGRPDTAVYWQVDLQGRIRTGKVIRYDAATGHRSHQGTTWIHALWRLPEFNLQQCLFGEHLLRRYNVRPVGVVESEKTALVASVMMPQMVWVATGGMTPSLERLDALRNRDVVIYPDLDATEDWRRRILPYLKRICHTAMLSTSLEERATETDRARGADLADFLIGY